MDEQSVKVEIFGTTFSIRCTDNEDRDYLIALAKYVDRNMFEIARKGKLTNTTNIAILTALNIADELKQEHARHEKTVGSVKDRTRSCITMIERAQQDDGAPIEVE